jgi:hypothetical protein
VPEGGLVLYKLVIERDTGDFRGAGVIMPSETARPTGPSLWTAQLVLGLSAGLTHVRGVAGAEDELVITGDGTIDTLVAFDDGDNAFITILEIEQGIEGEPRPFLKSSDRVRLDILYTRYLTPRIGPYVSFRGIAEVFPSFDIVEDDTVIRRIRLDGTLEDELLVADDTFSTGVWLPSLRLREGAGANFRVVSTRAANFSLRLGLGFRQGLFNELFIEDDAPDTEPIEYRQVDNFNLAGIEAVLTGDLRIGSLITYTTNFDAFTDFREMGDPAFDWRNALSLRLASWVSIDYAVNLVLEPLVTRDLQVTQDVLLRFSWEI